jgi:hypothetical protein
VWWGLGLEGAGSSARFLWLIFHACQWFDLLARTKRDGFHVWSWRGREETMPFLRLRLVQLFIGLGYESGLNCLLRYKSS